MARLKYPRYCKSSDAALFVVSVQHCRSEEILTDAHSALDNTVLLYWNVHVLQGGIKRWVFGQLNRQRRALGLDGETLPVSVHLCPRSAVVGGGCPESTAACRSDRGAEAGDVAYFHGQCGWCPTDRRPGADDFRMPGAYPLEPNSTVLYARYTLRFAVKTKELSLPMLVMPCATIAAIPSQKRIAD